MYWCNEPWGDCTFWCIMGQRPEVQKINVLIIYKIWCTHYLIFKMLHYKQPLKENVHLLCDLHVQSMFTMRKVLWLGTYSPAPAICGHVTVHMVNLALHFNRVDTRCGGTSIQPIRTGTFHNKECHYFYMLSKVILSI